MGYDIFFEQLTMKRKQENGSWDYVSDEQRDKIVADFRSSNEDAYYCLNELGVGSQYGRWSSHDTDLAKFSKQYPDVLFELNCTGEESGDIWTVYALNGKVQIEQADIVIKPFNPEKLVEMEPV